MDDECTTSLGTKCELHIRKLNEPYFNGCTPWTKHNSTSQKAAREGLQLAQSGEAFMTSPDGLSPLPATKNGF